MPKWAWYGVAVAAIIIAVAVGYPIYAAARAKAEVKAECQALAQQLSLQRIQGGDVAKAAALQTQLIDCMGRAKEAGVKLDEEGILLSFCTGPGEQIEQEWAHYRSTSYDDPVKRENTRSTILRLGEEMNRCYGTAIESAADLKALVKLQGIIEEQIASSRRRISCYSRGSTGCSRTGVNEPHGTDKAGDERERVLRPLQTTLTLLLEKRRSLDPEWAKAHPAGEEGAPNVAAVVGGDGTVTITQVPDRAQGSRDLGSTLGGRDRHERGA